MPKIGGAPSEGGESGSDNELHLFDGLPWKEAEEKRDGVSQYDLFNGEEPWLASVWDNDDEPVITKPLPHSGDNREYDRDAVHTVDDVVDEFHRLYGNLLSEYQLNLVISNTKSNADLTADCVLEPERYQQQFARSVADVLLHWSPEAIVGYAEELEKQYAGGFEQD